MTSKEQLRKEFEMIFRRRLRVKNNIVLPGWVDSLLDDMEKTAQLYADTVGREVRDEAIEMMVYHTREWLLEAQEIHPNDLEEIAQSAKSDLERVQAKEKA